MSTSQGPDVGERWAHAGQQPDGTQIDVLVEPLPDPEQQLPERDMIFDAIGES
jgi:hypothetical protein